VQNTANSDGDPPVGDHCGALLLQSRCTATWWGKMRHTLHFQNITVAINTRKLFYIKFMSLCHYTAPNYHNIMGHHNPELNFNIHCCESLKSHNEA